MKMVINVYNEHVEAVEEGIRQALKEYFFTVVDMHERPELVQSTQRVILTIEHEVESNDDEGE